MLSGEIANRISPRIAAWVSEPSWDCYASSPLLGALDNVARRRRRHALVVSNIDDVVLVVVARDFHFLKDKSRGENYAINYVLLI